MDLINKNIFNYSLAIGLMIFVLVCVISLFAEEQPRHWLDHSQPPSYHCGWPGESPCDIEDVNNFRIKYYKEEKRIAIKNMLWFGYVVHDVYSYNVSDVYIYIIGKLEYVEGRTPAEVMIRVYPPNHDDYADYLIFSKVEYLPHLIKINSVTGELTLYNTTQEIPEQERTIYYDMIVKNNLNVKELEVHIPPDEVDTYRTLMKRVKSSDGKTEWVVSNEE